MRYKLKGNAINQNGLLLIFSCYIDMVTFIISSARSGITWHSGIFHCFFFPILFLMWLLIFFLFSVCLHLSNFYFPVLIAAVNHLYILACFLIFNISFAFGRFFFSFISREIRTDDRCSNTEVDCVRFFYRASKKSFWLLACCDAQERRVHLSS